MVSAKTSISDAARGFATTLAPRSHLEGQEALRFARWFGEERPAADVRPSDVQAYVETFGVSSPNAGGRADALKAFLSYAHRQKLMPERLVSHVRVRRAPRPRLVTGAGGASMPEVRLTPDGRQALVDELDSLTARRPQITADLRAARADGDVSENAPLDAAREAQGQLEARIREIENMLRLAVVSETVGGPSSSAHIGSSVVLSNMATGGQLAYQLVSAAEARPGTGRLSIESPVGQAVVGRHAGDVVEVQAPSGVVRFRIESIQA